MLKVKENNIKLQIWDTVSFLLCRLGKKVFRLSPEVIIEMLLELFLFMISVIGTVSIILPSGLKKPRLMDHLHLLLFLWETKVINRLSTYGVM